MKHEEISPYAERVTFINQRTILTFKNKSQLVGYFESTSPELKKKNQWNFIPTPNNIKDKKNLTVVGDDLIKIEIVNI